MFTKYSSNNKTSTACSAKKNKDAEKTLLRKPHKRARCQRYCNGFSNGGFGVMGKTRKRLARWALPLTFPNVIDLRSNAANITSSVIRCTVHYHKGRTRPLLAAVRGLKEF